MYASYPLLEETLKDESAEINEFLKDGVISDDDELRIFLNGELKKDKDRDPEDSQKETDIIKLKKQKIK